MDKILLIDFGSTFTKITALNLCEEKIIGCASSFTTVETDINEGLEKAIENLEKKTGKLGGYDILACSSAAGGLKMVVSGLVESVTSKAAREACLGAGAKVVKTYAYEMTKEDIEEIENISPEIFLLAGGIDGGDKKCILHNAKALAMCNKKIPIIIAGNSKVSIKCKEILENREVYIVENVMPKFGKLNINPAQEKIREIFLNKIICAKGITKINNLISGILMPTPVAMMKAMKLLSEGYEEEKGIGELMAIDLGGATTDVYSIGSGYPTESNVIYKGIEEPYIKRTVEGDIGMRYSIEGIVDEIGIEEIAKKSNLSVAKANSRIEYLKENPDFISKEKEFVNLDFTLASKAVEIVCRRHCGSRETIYTSNGIAYLQKGKDLTNINQIVATGGSIIHLDRADDMLKNALFSYDKPEILKPKKANFLVDKKYILAAMGLLSQYYPKIALKIMKKELRIK
ncbi:methylaspartate mutase accessory protein GlmL [Terrisporobacter sp.]